jgi:predicted aldo/keto reductase-like oxidoreductase
MKDTENDKISRRRLLTIGAAGAATAVTGGIALSQLLTEEAHAKKKVPQVPRRTLGKTKQKIPILLMGGSIAFDRVFDTRLAEAYRYGVDYIDTADCYAGGASELGVGAFHKRGGIRKKLWITSKSDKHDPAGFEKTVAQSLKRMQTRYVDLYYLHMLKDPGYLSAEMAKMAAKLKKQGKIRFFGFSCHHNNVVDLLNRAAKLSWIDSIMFRYNFRKYNDAALNKAIDACHKANIGLIAMKTQGAAASFKARWTPFQKSGRFTQHQAVLKAVWADKRITAAVSHMDTLGKLRQNIAAALDKSKLSQAEIESLERYAKATRSLACDGCDHLCGANVAAPVQIGDTMRYLMYHDVYGQPDEAKRLFAQLPAAARDLGCVDFSRASAACPNQIDLDWHMKRALSVLT